MVRIIRRAESGSALRAVRAVVRPVRLVMSLFAPRRRAERASRTGGIRRPVPPRATAESSRPSDRQDVAAARDRDVRIVGDRDGRTRLTFDGRNAARRRDQVVDKPIDLLARERRPVNRHHRASRVVGPNLRPRGVSQRRIRVDGKSRERFKPAVPTEVRVFA